MTDREFNNAKFGKGDAVFYLGVKHEVEIVDFKTQKLGIRNKDGFFRFLPYDRIQLYGPIIRTIIITNT